MRRITNIGTLVLSLTLMGVTASAQECPGDLDSDRQVTVDEILKVVNAALVGCAGGNITPLPTQLPTPTATSGTTARFVDDRDGTITDTRSGLMWEKKVSQDGTPGSTHDVDNTYQWSGRCSGVFPLKFCQPTAEASALCRASIDGDSSACEPCARGTCMAENGAVDFETVWTWIAELNDVEFAGHSDWRIPNIMELTALDSALPLYWDSFQTSGCFSGCDDLTNSSCSCTKSVSFYWSSTSGGPNTIWGRASQTGNSGELGPTVKGPIRAVRGGP